MIKTLYRPKRMRDGKRITSRLYSLKIRLDGESRILQIPLGVSDRQVAEEKARQIVQEREKELHGILAPKSIRDGAAEPLSKHLTDFIADLRAQGRNHQYIAEFENRITLLINECGWRCARDVTADSLVKWRSEQKKAAKTLNEYLASAKGFLKWMVQHRRVGMNPLDVIVKSETRGKEVRQRRAYSDIEMLALLKTSGKHRIVYLTAFLTGIRHRIESPSLE
jgi:hypothetical protein